MVDDSIIYDNVRYGKLARRNYLIKMGRKEHQNAPTLVLLDPLLLWRSTNTKVPQQTHVDTLTRSYHLVMTMTKNYTIEICPGTYLLIENREKNKYRVTEQAK